MTEIFLIKKDKFNATQHWLYNIHCGVTFEKHREDNISPY